MLTMVGWAVLAGSYYLVLPVFGVPSTVTWALAWVGWLGAILGPVHGAVRSGRFRRIAPIAMWSAGGLLAAILLAVLRPPARTVDSVYQWHRADLDQLAAEYRAGSIDRDRPLPWRLRFLSIDGHAHVRCAEENYGCGLFLLLYQNLRGEAGAGIAYFPMRPAGVTIATAPGASGEPQRELGHGWWLVD
ncbi:hypothetical protein [Actinoplanes sp. NPDC049681]|uniref:hypothetical protein n=1 Tax=Actinoplanes sp. NPDC049681 TaxID=3363905 RepID=UPI00379AB3CC